jgi:hypothetical protein
MRKKETLSLLKVLKDANASRRESMGSSLLRVLRERTRHRKTVENRDSLLRFIRPSAEKK